MFRFTPEDRFRAIRCAYFLGCDFKEKIGKIGKKKVIDILDAFPGDDDENIDDMSRCLEPLRRFVKWFEDKNDKSFPKLRSSLKSVAKLPDDWLNDNVAKEFLCHEARDVMELATKTRASAEELLTFRKQILPDFANFDAMIVMLDVGMLTQAEKTDLLIRMFLKWQSEGNLQPALESWMKREE
jgi:5'-3' exonuclease